ncbi:MAG: hydroxymethylbilane synthase [Verrucomicrobiota bacterium]|jgi:hydroxymethylbilane synthase
MIARSMASPVRIATRGSALALAQAHGVLGECQAAFPGQPFEIVVIKTTGDKLQAASLAGGELPKGLFTKELENALLAGQADLAVHSLKDLPTELPAGLKLGAVLPRADVRDVLVYRHIEAVACPSIGTQPVRQNQRGFKPEVSIAGLPHAATIGTGSTRRTAQVLHRRPDLKIVPIRGNVGTRLSKLAAQPELDAILLAAAGLDRLELRYLPGAMLSGNDVPPGLAISRLSLGEMLPCVGQGAIGIETRAGDVEIENICARLNHAPTLACVTAERAFLAGMGGGCQIAVAAYAQVDGSELWMRAVSFLGPQVCRGEARRAVGEATQLGAELARQLQKS